MLPIKHENTYTKNANSLVDITTYSWIRYHRNRAKAKKRTAKERVKFGYSGTNRKEKRRNETMEKSGIGSLNAIMSKRQIHRAY